MELVDLVDQRIVVSIAGSRMDALAAFLQLREKAFPGTAWTLTDDRSTDLVAELVFERVTFPQTPEVEPDRVTAQAARLLRVRERLREELAEQRLETGMISRLFPQPDAFDDDQDMDEDLEETREELCDRLGTSYEKVIERAQREQAIAAGIALERDWDEALAIDKDLSPSRVRARRSLRELEASTGQKIKPTRQLSAAERAEWERRRLGYVALADKVFSRKSPVTKTVWRPWVLVAFWGVLASLGVLGLVCMVALLTAGPGGHGPSIKNLREAYRPETRDEGHAVAPETVRFTESAAWSTSTPVPGDGQSALSNPRIYLLPEMSDEKIPESGGLVIGQGQGSISLVTSSGTTTWMSYEKTCPSISLVTSSGTTTWTPKGN